MISSTLLQISCMQAELVPPLAICAEMHTAVQDFLLWLNSWGPELTISPKHQIPPIYVSPTADAHTFVYRGMNRCAVRWTISSPIAGKNNCKSAESPAQVIRQGALNP